MMKQKEKNQRVAHRRVRQEEQRSLTLASSSNAEQPALEICDEDEKPKKNMETYEQLFSHRTQFFSTYSPDLIEEALVNFLRKEKIEPSVNKNKYKIKFKKEGKDELNAEQNDDVEMCVRILQVLDQKDTFCVEFTKSAGNQPTFLKLFDKYKNDEDCLSFANDAVLEDQEQ